MKQFPGKGRRILVVEDDATNRSVLARQLGMVGSIDAEMAINGEDGLARWLEGGFALVLSDLHMPVMDGFGLVRAIRSREAAGVRMPVLAFSADVRLGQAERARDAGFDELLSKPMQLDGLRAVLGRWLDGAADARRAETPAAVATAAEPAEFDVRTLCELVGDEPGLVLEILEYFDQVAADIRAGLQSAVLAGDTAAAGMLAHRLKSSARSVGALPLALRCERLEESVESGRGDRVAPLVAQVVHALDAALAAMRRWRAGSSAALPDMTRNGP